MAKKILIIEDNEAILRSVAQALTEAGYEVTDTSDPLTGVSKASTGEYDLILLDIIMPDYSGYQVIEMIQEKINLKESPVIIFSNLDRPEDKELVMSMGAAGFISKADMDNEKLVSRVKKFFG